VSRQQVPEVVDAKLIAAFVDARREPVFTTGQIAKMCKVAMRTVSKWFDAGLLKGYRIPAVNPESQGDRRVLRSELYRFLLAQGMADVARLVCPKRLLVVGVDAAQAADLKRGLPEAVELEAAVDQFAAGLAVSDGLWPLIVCEFASRPAEVAMIAAVVRRHPATNACTLVALLGDDQLAGDVLPAGVAFDAVFKRPFDGDEFSRTLGKALGLRAA
jgi:two-component system response regulator RpaA